MISTVLRTRLRVEPIIRDLCRRDGRPEPNCTDEELAALGNSPDRMSLMRFAAAKVAGVPRGDEGVSLAVDEGETE